MEVRQNISNQIINYKNTVFFCKKSYIDPVLWYEYQSVIINHY